jgi:hypothetical protein
MKRHNKNLLALFGASSLFLASSAFSVEVIPIESFDPNTFFEDGITAGIDFDDGSVTQTDFLGIPASNSKSFNVTTNEITFDLQVINANLGNQNRNRNNANAGDLITDFEQFYGRHPDTGNAIEATLTLTGLQANTDYQVSFFTANVGCCQTRTFFYDGTSSEDPLITNFRTSGNQNNYSSWSPGVTLQFNSGTNGEIVVTMQAEEYPAGANFESRLGICGISVVSLGPPPVTNDLQITSVEVDPATDQVSLTFTGDASTTYSCFSSSDLVDFSTVETPVSGSLTTDENGFGSVVLSSSELARFYRLEPIAVP